jgi:dTDP-4-amino-4,6-dideoxygalactose transaminase
MRPQLPTAQQILPYVCLIDQSRIYSNFGPLASRLEARLAAHFGAADTALTTVANATLGLTLALAAQGAKAGTLCVIPAWTFIASAQAAAVAGLVPFFVDVDPATWALDPQETLEVISRAPGEVGAVMPVMPFGRPIDFEGWDRFRSRTGLPVVIDAAAGFDSLRPTETPAVVSLHATKVIGVGEGGFVLSTDPGLIRNIRTRENFGFDGVRDASVGALNAKLSEYQAAVGLAALDEWPHARSVWLAMASAYRERLARSRGARLQEGFGQSWVSSVCVFELDGQEVTEVEARLENAGIETRYWWGAGAHAHQSTLERPRTALPVTEQLARSTIAVPFFRDMQAADIDRVVGCVLAHER